MAVAKKTKVKKAKKKSAPKSVNVNKGAKKVSQPVTKKAVKAISQKAAPKAAAKPAQKTKVRGTSLTPFRDGVLVERVVESDRTSGGLYIPASAVDKPLKGVVVSAGRGKFSKRGKFRPLDVQAGDEVVFAKFAGTEITVDGRDYLLVREDEILGVVSN